MLDRASLSPGDVSYVEAHGTSTKVGDAEEAASLGLVFANAHTQQRRLRISSVKGNIGHMETAAAAVSLAKVVVMLRNRTFVGTAGHETPNVKLKLTENRLRVVVEPEAFPEDEKAEDIVIGINSFGYGGANGHALLSSPSSFLVSSSAVAQRFLAAFESQGNNTWIEAQEVQQVSTVPPRMFVALPLSSSSPETLEKELMAWKEFPFPDMDHLKAAIAVQGALLSSNTAARHRGVWVGDLKADQDSFFSPKSGALLSTDPTVTEVIRNRKSAATRVGFVFSGQGGHHARMGAGLYARFEEFRKGIIAFDEAFERHSGVSLRRKFGFCGIQPMKESDLEAVTCQLPCTIAVQVALVRLLESMGVSPSAVCGHSSGEMVAAYCAGVTDLDSLARITHARASGQDQDMEEGAMASVGCSSKVALELMTEANATSLDIACFNSANNVTLAGPVQAMKRVGLLCKERSIMFVLLPVRRAFHSRYTYQLRDGFMRDVGNLISRPIREDVSFISSVRGRKTTEPLDQAYWWTNVSTPVRFEEACKAMGDYVDTLVEIGPHAVLRAMVLDNVPSIPYCAPLRRSRNPQQADVKEFLNAVSMCFLQGVNVDWLRIQVVDPVLAAQVELPPPVWNHKPYRFGLFKNPRNRVLPGTESQATQRMSPELPSLNEKKARHQSKMMSDALSSTDGWSLQNYPWMLHHRVAGGVVVPAAMYISAALEAAGGNDRGAPFNTVLNAVFERFLSWNPSNPVLPVKMGCTPYHFEYTMGGNTYARGSLARRQMPLPLTSSLFTSERCDTTVSVPLFYKSLRKYSNVDFGESFRRIQSCFVCGRDDDVAIANLAPPVDLDWTVHPTILDACFQLCGIAFGLHIGPCVPTSLAAFSVDIPAAKAAASLPLRAQLLVTNRSVNAITADVDLLDGHTLIAAVRGVVLSAVAQQAPPSLSLITPSLQPETVPQVPAADFGSNSMLEAVKRVVEGLPSSRVVRVLTTRGVGEQLRTVRTPHLRLVYYSPGAFLDSSTYDVVAIGNALPFHRVRAILSPGGYAVYDEGRVVRNPAQSTAEAVVGELGLMVPKTGVIGGCGPLVDALKMRFPHRLRVLTDDTLANLKDICESWPLQVLVDLRCDVHAASALLKDVVSLEKDIRPVTVFSIGRRGSSTSSVEQSAMLGFTRSARTELLSALTVMAVEMATSECCLEESCECLERALYAVAREGPSVGELELLMDNLVPRLLSRPARDAVDGKIECMAKQDMKTGKEKKKDYRLVIDRPGQLQTLHLERIDITCEGVSDDDIRVNVVGAALHFKDVLLAMNMLPGFRPVLGIECSGTITAMGERAAKNSDLKVIRP